MTADYITIKEWHISERASYYESMRIGNYAEYLRITVYDDLVVIPTILAPIAEKGMDGTREIAGSNRNDIQRIGCFRVKCCGWLVPSTTPPNPCPKSTTHVEQDTSYI